MRRFLQTARISDVYSVIFCKREMVSFELSKEIEKYVFRLITSVGQREKSESP